MGACYSCDGCGKCRSWMESITDTCPRCGSSLERSQTRCPECGAHRPPNPGAPGVASTPSEESPSDPQLSAVI